MWTFDLYQEMSDVDDLLEKRSQDKKDMSSLWSVPLHCCRHLHVQRPLHHSTGSSLSRSTHQLQPAGFDDMGAADQHLPAKSVARQVGCRTSACVANATREKHTVSYTRPSLYSAMDELQKYTEAPILTFLFSLAREQTLVAECWCALLPLSSPFFAPPIT